MSRERRWTLAALAGMALACWAGCASYVTPGRGVSMASLTGVDADIATRMKREPAALFPARLAVVRVQAPEYRSYRTDGYGQGAYSVVFTKEFEREEDYARLGKLPMVGGVGCINRLLMPRDLRTDHELRLAASSLKADLLLVYTLDTSFRIDQHDVGPLTLISLGMAPSQEAKVTATASMALFDVRTGYVYGVADGTARDTQLASAWNSSEAVDTSRLRAEGQAFRNMLDQFEKTWTGVVAQYAGVPGELHTSAPQ